MVGGSSSRDPPRRSITVLENPCLATARSCDAVGVFGRAVGSSEHSARKASCLVHAALFDTRKPKGSSLATVNHP